MTEPKGTIEFDVDTLLALADEALVAASGQWPPSRDVFRQHFRRSVLAILGSRGVVPIDVPLLPSHAHELSAARDLLLRATGPEVQDKGEPAEGWESWNEAAVDHLRAWGLRR